MRAPPLATLESKGTPVCRKERSRGARSTWRCYSLDLIAGLDRRDWFRQPTEGVTHIAWQVGHLATSQYSLGLVRLRGAQVEDAQLVPPEFLAPFVRGSVPDQDPTKYPTPDELVETLDRVHAAVKAEIARHSDQQLELPQLGKPHPLFNTKLGGLFWCRGTKCCTPVKSVCSNVCLANPQNGKAVLRPKVTTAHVPFVHGRPLPRFSRRGCRGRADPSGRR